MKTIIIAEAGVNHNGDVNIAYKLIDAAAKAEVDYIKFQTYITDLIVDQTAKKAEYQNANMGIEGTQYDMIKKLELSIDDFKKIKDYCTKKNLRFLTSTGDLISLGKIKDFNLDYIKIGSGELTNSLLLRKVCELGKPVILSTGMANLGEIEQAINTLCNGGIKRNEIIVLHCNTEYPTPLQDVNLKAMQTIANAFDVKVGYSDHTIGIEVSLAAVAMGAVVIEKHFTLDKNLSGPDHSSSLEPKEMTKMVTQIRNIEIALSGNGQKEPSNSEIKNRELVRKSLFSSRQIIKGETFSEKNITSKRPGDGIPANEIDMVFGKISKTDIPMGRKINFNDIQW